MAPFVTIDETPDFATSYSPSIPNGSASRTLLLSPPALAAHPEALSKALEGHDRSYTDIHMLDRLSAGLANLPSTTYDIILLLTEVDHASTKEPLLSRTNMAKIFDALKPGGVLRSQDGSFGAVPGPDKTEAILAGLILNTRGDGMMKPEIGGGSGVVMLKFGSKRSANGKLIKGSMPFAELKTAPAVGFVDFTDDLDNPIITGEDDELIDEDDFLTEEDKRQGIIQPLECQPKTGKRRRACKDCTCGLKEKLEAEDQERREKADQTLNTLQLKNDELAELDFTVQGKVGSCGNCALGDAFRCASCPYIGLPVFKPGEEVRLFNDDIQL